MLKTSEKYDKNQKKIECYKNNDYQIHTMIIKKLQQISTYQKADDNEKKIMKKHEKNKIMQQ